MKGKISFADINRLLIPLFCAELLFVSSCSLSYGTLLSDYNGNFQPEEQSITHPVPQPGDPDFHQEDMLMSQYFVSNGSSLNLAAPEKCKSYKWSFYNKDDQLTELVLRLRYGSTTSTRIFAFYVPDTNLKPDTYRLTLTVVGNDDVEYKDSCLVIIWDDEQG